MTALRLARLDIEAPQEPSQQELVKSFRGGMGNLGLMTVKSRECCRSRMVTKRPGLLLRRMEG
jgi:hypothetical protein